MTSAEDLGRGLGGAPRSAGPSGAAVTASGISGSLLERLSGELEGLVAKTSPAVVAVAQQRGQGGVRQGDLLLGVNGAKVATVDDVQRILVLARAPSASLELLRGRARRSVEVAPSLAEAA